VTLVLKGGERRNEDSSRGTVRLVSKVPIPIQNILNFAMK
jgi:hypothetical protein